MVTLLISAVLAVSRPDPTVLENGARVIVMPIAGANRVAMESFYDVGFFDEPQGLTQGAHLVEHLMCMGATGDGPGAETAGAAWSRLSARGMVNAETMADFTHYDYEGPAEDLEAFLRTEGARLSSLKITPELLAQEAPRCYAECANVEATAIAPVFKFAIMAAHQGWRYGSNEAFVKSGLEAVGAERIGAFRRSVYAPERLTLVIAGGVQADRAIELAKMHLGGIPRSNVPARASIDWEKLPPLTSMRWDSSASVVILTYPIPQDKGERLALSLYGETIAQLLAADAAASEVSRFTICSNVGWPCSDLPFFVAATLKVGVEPVKAAAVLRERVAAAAASPIAPMAAQQARFYFESIATPRIPTLQELGAQAKMMKGVGTTDPMGLAIANSGLQRGVQDRLARAGIPALNKAMRMKPEEVRALLGATLKADKARVTEIVGK